jgi:hypothetical protein
VRCLPQLEERDEDINDCIDVSNGDVREGTEDKELLLWKE